MATNNETATGQGGHTAGEIKVAEFPVDEPGRNHDRYLYSVDNRTCIGKVHRLDEYTALPPDPEGKANAARLVACWNACAGMADPAATIRELREAVREEAGWVIERHINGELRYWCGRGVGDEMFLPNHLEAVRFGREQDAACVLAWCLKGYGRAAQHIWTDTTALRAAGGGA